jgi:NitT/TauT family transport system permease protein
MNTETKSSFFHRFLSRFACIFPSLILIAFVGLASWELLGRILGVHPNLLPTPSRILLEIFREMPIVARHAVATTCEILGGYCLAVVCGFPIALLLAMLPSVCRVAAPFLRVLSKAPVLVMTPLLFIWLGYGPGTKVFVPFLACFFTVLAGALVGLMSPGVELLDLSRAAGAGRIQVLLKLRMPASLPHVFESLRAAVPMAVLGAAVAEFVEGDGGLGYLLLASAFQMRMPLGFAALATLALIGLMLYWIVVMLECAVIPWHVKADTGT